MSFWDQFGEIWLVDFEFRCADGGLPEPVCMVGKEMRSGRIMNFWEENLRLFPQAPFDVGRQSLFVAYYASAEMSCFLALDWHLPVNVLDLFPEFRNLTNGVQTPSGNGLLGALAWFGFDSISAAEKDTNRELILKGNYTAEDRNRILNYCESDVVSLEKLFKAMSPDLAPQALLRGRYMKSVALMERNGIPIDVPLFSCLKSRWEELKSALIEAVDRDYEVFEGQTFKINRFADWLNRQGISWPVLESGRLSLDDDTFKEVGRIHPEIELLRQVRYALSQMRLSDLAIGPDGRNRCLLSPFRAKTSRNQPSNTKFIFGPSVWLRGLIKPEGGYALAYVDWGQQEFGIAAVLSKDPRMMEAYSGGDPYLEFAKMARAVPENATKDTHPTERELYKATSLAVQYDMGPDSLALRLGITQVEARNLLEMHRRIFKKFWSWSDAAVDYAILHGKIHTVFGWEYHVTDKTKPRTLRNFPIQANGAEMLRIACCLATEQGIKVCAPVHDALLVQGLNSEIEEVVRATQDAMRKASEIVLSGFPLRSEAKIVHSPDRYMDLRGKEMWEKVMGLLKV